MNVSEMCETETERENKVRLKLGLVYHTKAKDSRKGIEKEGWGMGDRRKG